MTKPTILLIKLIEEIQTEDALHVYKNFKLKNSNEINGALKILQWIEHKKIIN